MSVPAQAPLLLSLDLAATFAFALNGALTAVRTTRLDVVGVLTLGVITGLGGGIIRDLLIGSLPPATFSDWRYLAVAGGGSLVAYLLGRIPERLAWPIALFDAAGLSFFCVTGASKALDYGLGSVQAVLLGAVTGVGGGATRDVLIRRVPAVLQSELYAIPALLGATMVVITTRTGVYGPLAAVGAAAACFFVRFVGIRFNLNAPGAPRD